jgi:hypothetical protein
MQFMPKVGVGSAESGGVGRMGKVLFLYPCGFY